MPRSTELATAWLPFVCQKIITTCTDRKRLKIDERLRARSLSKGSMAELASEWLSRIEEAPANQPAATVYGGRSFQEALGAAAFAGTELFVISTGLGLVGVSHLVPSYGLTLVRGSADDIAARCTERFNPTEWWSLVNQRLGRQTISDFVRSNQDDVFVVGLSSSYARLVESDLVALSDAEQCQLRIVGLSIERELPDALRKWVLPYDSRLDGPNSSVRGTRSDFASRAIRHFVEVILPKVGLATIDVHKSAVSELMEGWELPRNVKRERFSDEQIIALIRARIEVGEHSSTRMLRYLRDDAGIACEQTRFKNLFKRAIGEATS